MTAKVLLDPNDLCRALGLDGQNVSRITITALPKKPVTVSVTTALFEGAEIIETLRHYSLTPKDE